MIDLSRVEPGAFVAAYERTLAAALGAAAGAGLAAVVASLVAEPALRDARQAAYVLATIRHETAGAWTPRAEIGLGAGRAYGRPVRVVDPATGEAVENVYYGRGYVQLTWLANYRRLDRALAMGDRLWLAPDAALEPATAWRICVAGMTQGLFTGRRLDDYICGTACDFVRARRIVNGQDQARRIAGYAAVFERVLAGC